MLHRAFAVVALFAASAFGEPAALHDQIEAIRTRAKVPAVGVIVSNGGELVFRDAFGEAKPDDVWHIGSDTKAMTATLAARFVETGKLKWSTTLGEACPELKGKVADGWLSVSLDAWLTQTAGFPRTHEGSATLLAMRVREQIKTLSYRERRSLAIAASLKDAPPRKPGEKFEYANFNYIIAGHMLECVAKEDWETLIARELFTPLGITTAGFGPPPRLKGHDAEGGEIELDNPLTLGPAGTVHLTLDDWLKFCEVHTGRGPDGFLSKESLEKLQTPPQGNYAMGWITVKRPDGNIVLTHDGSNTFWYARAIVRPDVDRILLVAMNKADPKACDQITNALVASLFPTQGAGPTK